MHASVAAWCAWAHAVGDAHARTDCRFQQQSSSSLITQAAGESSEFGRKKKAGLHLAPGRRAVSVFARVRGRAQSLILGESSPDLFTVHSSDAAPSRGLAGLIYSAMSHVECIVFWVDVAVDCLGDDEYARLLHAFREGEVALRAELAYLSQGCVHLAWGVRLHWVIGGGCGGGCVLVVVGEV